MTSDPTAEGQTYWLEAAVVFWPLSRNKAALPPEPEGGAPEKGFMSIESQSVGCRGTSNALARSAWVFVRAAG